jgi:acetolactate synthase-1/2/3 large subunit
MQWRLPFPPRRVAINVDPIDATKNYAIDAVVAADARLLGPLADGAHAREPWAGSMQALRIGVRTRLAADPKTGDAMTFLDNTESALPSDTAVFADMCVAGYWLAGHLRVGTRRGLHFPMGWGTLGFAPAAAIGAAAARHDLPTVAFVGDGGMMFGVGELSALHALRAPCTIVVVDDDGYGMLRYGSACTPANELPPVDWAHAAHAFGIKATRVSGFGDEYTKELAAAAAAGEPRLLHVRAQLHPPVTTTPFWPLKDSHSRADGTQPRTAQ